MTSQVALLAQYVQTERWRQTGDILANGASRQFSQRSIECSVAQHVRPLACEIAIGLASSRKQSARIRVKRDVLPFLETSARLRQHSQN